MDDTLLFAWGFIAFLLAVGPLGVAALLDLRDKNRQRKKEARARSEEART